MSRRSGDAPGARPPRVGGGRTAGRRDGARSEHAVRAPGHMGMQVGGRKVGRGCSSAGRAPGSHPGGQGFESPQLHSDRRSAGRASNPVAARRPARGHRSSVVEHSIRNRAVVGSNPTGGSAEPVDVYLGTPRLACGSSSVGRASASQAEGRGFEPRLPLWPAQDAGLRPAVGSMTGAPWCNWQHA